jgi:hypothetical protein
MDKTEKFRIVPPDQQVQESQEASRTPALEEGFQRCRGSPRAPARSRPAGI